MRPAAATAVLGLALAVGAPTAWAVTRPEVAAGPPVQRVLERTDVAPQAPPMAPTSQAPPPGAATLPPVTVRDAAPSDAPVAPPPVRLDLPGLGVTAPVDPVGIAGDGQMELPEDVDRVGWYRHGPQPGADGNAVLAGHVDDREQGPGALFPVRDAEPGDEVTVTDAAGATTRWRVVSRELVQKQVLPLDEIFARGGPPRLVVITCGGPFLPEFSSYRDNVVVVAEPVVDGAP
ncbi:class F sortase [Blastococcus sp. VKM Ac-2987]|uniref:class F sortase n=1 Tax=Blastococcus sp. VKM Ac-2987 TaxID=3004141 RepID=UPI0022AB7FA1|nr:class F sortase [Blastococcus sp. VKM Ac-2987]MCZ2858643.1 sortase [Blastococcus sp. VKM Ac-2987]